MLNTEHFVLLGGNPDSFDEETRTRCAAGADLCRLQEKQHASGRRSAVLTHSIYGWYVRSGSGLDNFGILCHRRGLTKDEAIAWGIDWANVDPDNREFIAHKHDLAEEG